MENEMRITTRLPHSAVAYLDRMAEEHFTSRNAQVVRAIREAMKAETLASKK